MKFLAAVLAVCLLSADAFAFGGGGLFSRLRSRRAVRAVVQPVKVQQVKVRQVKVQPIVQQQVVRQKIVKQQVVQPLRVRQKVRVQQVVPMYAAPVFQQQYAAPVQQYSSQLYELNGMLNQLDCIQGY